MATVWNSFQGFGLLMTSEEYADRVNTLSRDDIDCASVADDLQMCSGKDIVVADYGELLTIVANVDTRTDRIVSFFVMGQASDSTIARKRVGHLRRLLGRVPIRSRAAEARFVRGSYRVTGRSAGSMWSVKFEDTVAGQRAEAALARTGAAHRTT